MESIGGDLTTMAPRPFSAEHLAAIRALAEKRRYAAGEYLLKLGHRRIAYLTHVP